MSTRCADASEARGEPLYGTASYVQRWLLLEQPGSWGRDALAQSGLPESVARELRRRAQDARIRVVLIRRAVRFASKGRQCYFVNTEPHASVLSHMTLGDPADLLDVDLTPLVSGGVIAEAQTRTEPLFLVCTHGKRDACCSIRGNQVSRVACAQPGMDAWESAHIGGDRFAANVVCFPHGVYYGRVSSADVAGLMGLFEAGSISLDHYRGRCCYPFAVQAAEYFVRRELDQRGIEDVVLVGAPATEGTTMSSRFSLADGRMVSARVAVLPGAEGFRLTCGSTGPDVVPRYELISCDIVEAR